MAVAPAAASSPNPAITPAKDSRASIASNFDAFLTLLTTQLRNQSPLDPLDTNQFTQQLVQFAQVEQQLKQNDTLSALLTMSRSATTANAMSFVGLRVVADGSSAQLQDGKAEWKLDAPRGGTALITIRDARGNDVAAERITLSAGPQSFIWNGKTSAGGNAPTGDYRIVVDARDASGGQLKVKTEVTGVVDGADFSSDEPVLRIGSSRLPLSSVKSASRQ